MPTIKYNPEITIADDAFTVTADTLPELFETSAKALLNVMCDVSKIEPKRKITFSIKSEKIDTLLYDFLSKIISLKDAEQMLFGKFKVKIETDSTFNLDAFLYGEKADPQKHHITTDIKAVTMHMFEVQKTKTGYKARIIVDI